jgi:hypothetical protein
LGVFLPRQIGCLIGPRVVEDSQLDEQAELVGSDRFWLEKFNEIAGGSAKPSLPIPAG